MAELERRLKVDVLGGLQVRLGSTEFALAYEAAVLDLSKPTSVQRDAIDMIYVYIMCEGGQSERFARVDGPPGTGKSFVGVALLEARLVQLDTEPSAGGEKIVPGGGCGCVGCVGAASVPLWE